MKTRAKRQPSTRSSRKEHLAQLDTNTQALQSRLEAHSRELSARMEANFKSLEERMTLRGYSSKEAEDLLSSLGDTLLDNLFSRTPRDTTDNAKRLRRLQNIDIKIPKPGDPAIRANGPVGGERVYANRPLGTQGPAISANRTPQQQVEISPTELTRRNLMQSLTPEKQKTLGTFDESLVRTVIATVEQARAVDPERSDWDIHLAYRRSIEVETPDPLWFKKPRSLDLYYKEPELKQSILFRTSHTKTVGNRAVESTTEKHGCV